MIMMLIVLIMYMGLWFNWLDRWFYNISVISFIVIEMIMLVSMIWFGMLMNFL